MHSLLKESVEKNIFFEKESVLKLRKIKNQQKIKIKGESVGGGRTVNGYFLCLPQMKF